MQYLRQEMDVGRYARDCARWIRKQVSARYPAIMQWSRVIFGQCESRISKSPSCPQVLYLLFPFQMREQDRSNKISANLLDRMAAARGLPGTKFCALETGLQKNTFLSLSDN